MLDRGNNGVWRREAVALVAADIGTSDGGAQVRVFTRALGAASPSSIARDIDHGGINPVNAGGAGFHGGQARDIGDERRIPAGCSGKRDGKDGAEAVDDVGAEKQRNMQARV